MSDSSTGKVLSLDEINTLLSQSLKPVLTFGLEIEIAFSIDRKCYFDWLATTPAIPPTPLSGMNTEPTRLTDHRAAHASSPLGKATFSSFSTNSQESADLRQNLLHYFLAFLNRELPTSTKEGKMLIGHVLWGGTPKSANSDTWTLVHDDSLRTSRKAFGKTFNPPVSYDTIKQRFRCVGAELVSAVYRHDTLDYTVRPALEELNHDLQYDEKHGAWFTDDENLHVHFAIEDEDITLEFAQNLSVLYGLFENQIERFMKKGQRKSVWCPRLRKGMEKRRMYLTTNPETGETDLALMSGRRYTPAGFADEIYATKSLEELKSANSGYSAGEDIPGAKIPYDGKREWVALNLSMARPNKPTTFEFRHHHGTCDPDEIKFWVQFCGCMMRFAYLTARAGIQINNPGGGYTSWEKGPTFLETFVQKDILEIIGLSEEAKQHFRDRVVEFLDVDMDNLRAMEKWMIAQRVMQVKKGNVANAEMETWIMGQAAFKNALQSFGPNGLPTPALPHQLNLKEVKGLQNVGNELVALTWPDPAKRPQNMKDLVKRIYEDDNGRMKLWLKYYRYLVPART